MAKPEEGDTKDAGAKEADGKDEKVEDKKEEYVETIKEEPSAEDRAFDLLCSHAEESKDTKVEKDEKVEEKKEEYVEAIKEEPSAEDRAFDLLCSHAEESKDTKVEKDEKVEEKKKEYVETINEGPSAEDRAFDLLCSHAEESKDTKMEAEPKASDKKADGGFWQETDDQNKANGKDNKEADGGFWKDNDDQKKDDWSTWKGKEDSGGSGWKDAKGQKDDKDGWKDDKGWKGDKEGDGWKDDKGSSGWNGDKEAKAQVWVDPEELKRALYRSTGQRLVNEGAVMKGKINSIHKFGAFVQFGDGSQYKEALLHVSKMKKADGYPPRSIDDIVQIINKGDEVVVRIYSVDVVKGKVGCELHDGAESDICAADGAGAPTVVASGEPPERPEDAICIHILEESALRRGRVKALVANLISVGGVEKAELPRKPDEISLEQLTALRRRYEQAVELPLQRFAAHLKPALFRRVHTGTMDYMDESHEAYRRTFDFLETTNTWHDTDVPWRKIPNGMQRIGCAYQKPEAYDHLADRARDGFKMVIKLSHVATHVEKLENPESWWPALYGEKYSKLAFATVAFLWQFPPSFLCDDVNWRRLQNLADYLASEASGTPDARHVVDFRASCWYGNATYELLREKRWCLAWLHLNNEDKWASDIPTGWTDRVQTTNFVFMRLFGPDGRSHGHYDKKFIHELFDSCPLGTTSYVVFGNRETLENENPVPRPSVVNAVDFRTIFTKMDFVERIRSVRYKGDCPRLLDDNEVLLVNAFYLRFSQRARVEGIRMTTPVCNQYATKYYPKAGADRRCFEWYFPKTGRRLHLSLHDIKEEDDLWLCLRQLTGFEDIHALKAWSAGAAERAEFSAPETEIANATCLRWSERARMAGLLATTKIAGAEKNFGVLHWQLTNGEPLELDLRDLNPEQDVWSWFMDLSKLSPKEPATSDVAEVPADPWKNDAWKMFAGEMWRRPAYVPPSKKEEEVTEEKDTRWKYKEDDAWGSWQGSSKEPDAEGGQGIKRPLENAEVPPGKRLPSGYVLHPDEFGNPADIEMLPEWILLERTSCPGMYFYWNTVSAEETVDIPPPMQGLWTRERCPETGAKMYKHIPTGHLQFEAPPIDDTATQGGHQPPHDDEATKWNKAMETVRQKVYVMEQAILHGHDVDMIELQSLLEVLKRAEQQKSDGPA